jgi:hypothetical protein
MLEPGELLEFQRHFNKMQTESYSWNLWGAAYLMNAGCSDDGFEYFRAWLLAQGRDAVEKAFEDPDTRWKTRKASSRSSCTLRGRLTNGKLASKCPTPFFKERPGLNSVRVGISMTTPR